MLGGGASAALCAATAIRCANLPGARPLTPQEWGADPHFGAPGVFKSTLRIHPDRPLLAANPHLCGTNIQWVDGGDGLLNAESLDFNPQALRAVAQLAPSMIRYPGGAQADVYHWRTGIGPIQARGFSEHFHRREKQQVRMGTAEFLSLCQSTGAEPVITVNTATGSAAEAAEWLEWVNVRGVKSSTGSRLPKVKFWEIGNEPYLHEAQRQELWQSAESFAGRAQNFLASMRAVDPSVHLGLPLRSDRFSSGVPGTPLPGFNETVLSQVSERFDFVSVHNAYLPLALDRIPDEQTLYASMMSATETVRDDLNATRAQLDRHSRSSGLPMALTEYSPLVAIGTAWDEHLATPAGALYVADLLCLLATRQDILMAQHWSLIGNWFFGAVDSAMRPRPVFDVLRVMKELLKGQIVAVECQTSRSFAVSRVGVARGTSAVSPLTALASRANGKLRILVINKAPHAETELVIETGESNPSRVDVRRLAARAAFATQSQQGLEAWLPQPEPAPEVTFGSTTLKVHLPPVSLTLLTVPETTGRTTV